jgi:putative ABC transport system permease protein
MIKHYFLIAIRNLKKHKGSFLINLIGLSAGLACALLIYLWVHDEMSFDKFHAKNKQLYQVMEMSKENNVNVVHESTQGLLADAMAKDLPEVDHAVTVMSMEKEGFYFNVKTPDKTLKAAGMFAGKDFFSMFSFKLLNGNEGQVLSGKNNVVISDKLAANLFGTAADAVGKSITWEVAGMANGQGQVSGVFETPPANSSMHFDFVLKH